MGAPKKLYDTNVLMEARKSRKPLQGYTTALNLVEYPKGVLFKLAVLYPSKSEYNLAIKLSKDLAKKGSPIPAVDVLIAAMALSRGLTIVTRDKHFLLLKEICPDLKIEMEE